MRILLTGKSGQVGWELERTLAPLGEVIYAIAGEYAPAYERTVIWDDPAIGIDWPAKDARILSERDRNGVPLAQAEVFP